MEIYTPRHPPPWSDTRRGPEEMSSSYVITVEGQHVSLAVGDVVYTGEGRTYTIHEPYEHVVLPPACLLRTRSSTTPTQQLRLVRTDTEADVRICEARDKTSTLYMVDTAWLQ